MAGVRWYRIHAYIDRYTLTGTWDKVTQEIEIDQITCRALGLIRSCP